VSSDDRQHRSSLIAVYWYEEPCGWSLKSDARMKKSTIPDMQFSAEKKLRGIAAGYLASLGVWVSLAVLMAAEDKVRLGQRHIYTAYHKLLMVNGVWCLTFAILTPPIFYIVKRYPIMRPTQWRRGAAYLVGVAPFMLIFACVRWVLMPPWDATTQDFGVRSLHSFFGIFYIFADQVWSYLMIVVTAHASEYFLRSRQQEIEKAELQQALTASELQALKSQLHPHFLFNTLHGISTLVDSNRVRAKSMIVTLSSLLRTALQHGNADLISLDDELRFLQSYLELEKMRLEERLRVEWEIEPQAKQMLVPQLILQPLVENAIVHGIASSRTGDWLRIRAQVVGDYLHLKIQNSVTGHSRAGLGVGLPNTRARLSYLYAEDSSFNFALGVDGVATASLHFPAFAEQEHEPAGMLAARARAS
jgi:two-component system, LytTR family, sensor kinase